MTTSSSRSSSRSLVPKDATPSLTERDALINDLLEKMRRQLQEQLPSDTATLDQIEDIAGNLGRTLSQDIERRLVEQRSKKHRETRQTIHQGTRTICRCCSNRVRYKGEQSRSVVTIHGTLTFTRACYHCSHCQYSFAPVDDSLGLDSGTTTTQVRLWVALLASQLPFAQAATTLQLLTGVPLSAASMERLSVSVGTSLRRHQQQQAQAHQKGRLPEPEHKPKRLYIGLDGVFVPLRDAWKKDTSHGALNCRYGECKSGVIYEAWQDKSGRDSRVRTHAYVATLEKADAFASLLGTLAHQQGHHRAKEVIVLGDGAAWIWQLAAKQFSGAIQIVDFFHAAQHLAQVAEARFGNESAEGKAWLSARCEELKTNRLDKVLTNLREWHPTNVLKKQLRKNTHQYFFSNAERMRYQTFLERGYHIGSGVVEATCKQVVAQRLDQAGMHWRQETAEAIVALRAAQLSTVPTDLRPYCRMEDRHHSNAINMPA